MAKKLALLSGKGGSGKTSLSLCIANLLSSCGIKTLLVDCDFSTNGATYFFEDLLVTNAHYSSLWSLCQSKVMPQLKKEKEEFAPVKENFDFIPSVSKIDSTIIENSAETFFSFSIFNGIIDTYDVVIFDCQAGYSNILEEILPNVDETLFVMEADAISSSSIRSLHLKIGSFLSRKSYQVFNKVTPEEYEIYKKISGGTLFTNIESVLFDWTIRKAFALSQIPSIENVSYKFYEQILNICKILLNESDYIKKIETFSQALTKKKISEEKKELLQKLSLKKAMAKNNRIKLFLFLSTAYGILAFFLIYSSLLKKPFELINSPIELVAMGISMASAIIVVFAMSFAKKENDRGDSVSDIQRRLNDLDRVLEKYKI